MKKYNLIKMPAYLLFASMALLLTGCEDELEIEENATEKKLTLISPIKDCDFLPHSVYVDNGVSKVNSTNMLHFSSIDSYYLTLESLEQQKESHEDAFVNRYSHLNEEDLDSIEDLNRFDEDAPLKTFETRMTFSSLRKKAEILENNWLDTSDQRSFSWDNDPTKDLHKEGVEATLFNEYSEVMICNTVYKWMDDALLKVDITDPQAASALRMANSGSTATQVVASLGTATRSLSGVSAEFYTSNQRSSSCLYNVNRQKNFYSPGHKVIARQKIKGYGGLFNYTTKSITKSYKWRRGKWRKHRARISAGLSGQIHNPNYGTCGNNVSIHSRRTIKKRRRREYARRIPRSATPASRVGADRNVLSSWHIQHGNNFYYTFD